MNDDRSLTHPQEDAEDYYRRRFPLPEDQDNDDDVKVGA